MVCKIYLNSLFRSYPACRPHPSEERHRLCLPGWSKSRAKHEHSGLLFVLWFQSHSDIIALNISSLSVGAFFFINGFCGGNFPGKFSLGNFQGIWTRKFTHKHHSEEKREVLLLFSVIDLFSLIFDEELAEAIITNYTNILQLYHLSTCNT